MRGITNERPIFKLLLLKLLAFWIAVTLDLWRVARPHKVSPFFTTTRVGELDRDFAATVFGLLVVLETVDVDLGLVLLLELVAVLVVVGFKRATSTAPDEDEVLIGVIVLGGVSLLANKTGSVSGKASCEVGRRFHFSGLSAHAST